MVFDFTKCKSVHFSGLRLNEKGIPEIVGFKKLGFISTPVTVSQYGLYRYQLYEKSGDEDHRSAAIKCAEWLVQNADITDRDVFWWYNFGSEFLNIDPPWLCGLAQALSSWLLYIFRDIDNKWEEIAYKALNPLFYPVEDGGLSNKLDGFIFFEEYPSNPPSATLNGLMYVLIILHAFSSAGYKKVDSPFKLYTESLAKNLYRYDTGYWSLYDLWKIKRFSSLQYHWLHIYQLGLLYQITGIKKFYEWYKRWLIYWKSSNSRFFRVIHKLKEKTLIYTDIKI
jgi:heparosan-N-sulfate-glucuronate 5-epimerase